jgi:hypothetical protein
MKQMARKYTGKGTQPKPYTPPETENNVTSNVPVKHSETPCNVSECFTLPATRLEIGTQLGVTHTIVGRRLAELKNFHRESDLLTPDDKITEFGFDRIREYGELGKKGYSAKYEPIQPIHSSSAIVVRETAELDSKISQLAKAANTRVADLQNQITLMREKITQECDRAKDTTYQLTEAEQQAAIARGIKRGLAEFQLEMQARNATKENLTIQQLSEEI